MFMLVTIILAIMTVCVSLATIAIGCIDKPNREKEQIKLIKVKVCTGTYTVIFVVDKLISSKVLGELNECTDALKRQGWHVVVFDDRYDVEMLME
ncbi:hypothetical protein CD170_02825 [Staphylococcus aureus]|nr:hypothetical protein CD170_02825 [Staphylococcus aureus]